MNLAKQACFAAILKDCPHPLCVFNRLSFFTETREYYNNINDF